jgi:hypothetical protein
MLHLCYNKSVIPRYKRVLFGDVRAQIYFLFSSLHRPRKVRRDAAQALQCHLHPLVIEAAANQHNLDLAVSEGKRFLVCVDAHQPVQRDPQHLCQPLAIRSRWRRSVRVVFPSRNRRAMGADLQGKHTLRPLPFPPRLTQPVREQRFQSCVLRTESRCSQSVFSRKDAGHRKFVPSFTYPFLRRFF